MRELVHVNPFNDTAWDDFVQSQPMGWICHLSGWKRVLEKAFPHIRGYFLAVRENGILRAVLPVYMVSSWLTGRRLVSIPFATRSHPIFQDSEDLKMLSSEMFRLGREQKAAQIRIQCLAPEDVLEQLPGSVVSLQYKAHTLHLSDNPQEMFKRFHKNSVRMMVRRAEKSGVRIRSLSGCEDLRVFYNLYTLSRRRHGLPPHPESFIRLLWENFAPSDQIAGFLAEVDGSVIAGLLVFKFRDRVSAEYSGLEQNSQRFGAIPLLYWHAITEAALQGFGSFDFGRTAEDNVGLMEYKSRWGTVVSSLPVYYCSGNDKMSHPVTRASIPPRLLREVVARTPVPIVNCIGKIYYRFVG